MSSMIVRFLLVQLVRYVASAQYFGMVVLHAAWMLLALGTWGNDASGGFEELTKLLVRAFVRLGGVDADGHGDEGTIFAAWGRLSLGLYLVAAAWRAWRGERRPWAWWRVVLLSTAVALAGFVFAMWPASADQPGELAFVAVAMTLATGVSTAWAVGASRLADLLVAAIQRAPARTAAAA